MQLDISLSHAPGKEAAVGSRYLWQGGKHKSGDLECVAEQC